LIEAVRGYLRTNGLDCVEYEYRFAEYEYRFAEYEYRFAEYEYRFAEYEYRFAEYEYREIRCEGTNERFSHLAVGLTHR
jgi:hypothetical protein